MIQFSKSMLVDAYSNYVNNFAAGMDEIRTLQQNRSYFEEFLKVGHYFFQKLYLSHSYPCGMSESVWYVEQGEWTQNDVITCFCVNFKHLTIFYLLDYFLTCLLNEVLSKIQSKERASHDRLSIFGLMVKPIQRFPQFIMLIQVIELGF